MCADYLNDRVVIVRIDYFPETLPFSQNSFFAEDPMSVSRRLLLQGAAGGFLSFSASSSFAALNEQTQAVLFDAFAIFDPRPVGVAAQRLIGDRSPEFMRVWRTKQFEYTWLRNSGGRYQNFWDVSADALSGALEQLGISLSVSDQQTLLNSYLNLRPWPDVPDGVKALQSKGLRLGILSNFTDAMMASAAANAPDVKFDVLLSTDRVSRFKPDPKAYAMGEEALQLSKDKIIYVAFAGWDAVGATWFGYRTFWLNRTEATAERLSANIDGTGSRFEDLLGFVRA